MTDATRPVPPNWQYHTGQVLWVQVPPDPTAHPGAWNNAVVLVQADNGTQSYLLDSPNPGKIIALLKLAQSDRTFDFFSSPGNYIAAFDY